MSGPRKSYKHPMVKRMVSSIFSCRGICNFHTTGSGRQRMKMSSAVDNAPMMMKNVVCPDMQSPLISLIQKYWTGKHCSVFPTKAVTPQAATKIIAPVILRRNQSTEPRSLRSKIRIDIFTKTCAEGQNLVRIQLAWLCQSYSRFFRMNGMN